MKKLLEKLSKGETTVDEVLQAIEDSQDDAKKDMVPRSRLNAKNDEIKDLKEQLKSRDEQLDDLKTKATGNEELTQQINDLKADNKKTADDYQAKLDKQSFDFALERSLSGAKAKNPKAVKALLDTESIKLDGDKLLGIDDQLKGLKESDAYLFEDDEPKLKGRSPNPKQDPPKGVTKEKLNDMGYMERVKFKNDNPDLYQELTK